MSLTFCNCLSAYVSYNAENEGMSSTHNRITLILKKYSCGFKGEGWCLWFTDYSNGKHFRISDRPLSTNKEIDC